MKSILPWFCLAAMTNANVVLADEGIDAYRFGNYEQAADLLQQSKNKDPIIEYYLAKMRLYGYGILKNNDKAIRYFESAGNKGLLSAQKIMARYELIEANNPEKALYWFKKAAATDDTPALMYCAAAYYYGYGVRKNRDVARKYYIAAAKNGNSIAQYSVAKNFLKTRQLVNKKLGMIWLNKSVEQNNPAAQLLLAEQYINGSLVSKDLDKARELINLAMKQHYLPAYYKLGQLEYEQNNYASAQENYLKAAKENYIPAMLALAKLYNDDKSDLFNQHDAFLWQLKAAENGSKQACINLAKMYKDGIGTKADEHLAEVWKKKSETFKLSEDVVKLEVVQWLTNRKATKFTETAYELRGILTDWHNNNALKDNIYNQFPQMQDVTKKELYKPNFILASPNSISISEYYDILVSGKKLMDENWEPPTYLVLMDDKATLENQMLRKQQNASLGFDYLLQITKSGGEKEDYGQIFKKLEAQAVIGDTIAQFDVGQMYQYGIGVEKNIEEAVKYYELATAQGSLPAEYNLGIIYFFGRGIEPNYKEGLYLLTDAAFKGNDFAQYTLARIYEFGYKNSQGKEVIGPNKQQSLAMYNIASANNYGPAQYRLAEIMVREKAKDLSENGKAKRNKLIKNLYERALANNVSAAKLPLAFYYAMEHDPAKQKLAFDNAGVLAEQGNEDASLLLGLMYDRGIVASKDNDKAIKWYEKSGDNPVSDFILGTYTAIGNSVSQDIVKAQKLLQRSVDSGFSYANLNLAVINKQNHKSFLPYLTEALARGNSVAGLLLADYFLSKSTSEQQLHKAREIYNSFALQGDKDAQLKIGFLCEKGIGGKIDYFAAKKWYKMAAKQGQFQAQYLLARLYQLGKIGNGPDYESAKKWYQLAKNKYSQAAVALGYIYDIEEGDYKRAMENYKLADANGNLIGSFNLGLLYERGEGCPVDYNEARKLYIKAAEAAHKESMVQLAGLYLHGYGTSPDPSAALKWYKQAADLGDRNAEYQLGLLYETGNTTKIDLAKAKEYYELASQHGNEKASLALARLYHNGIIGEKNVEKAQAIYNSLAKNQNAYAQYQLANLCFQGVPADCKQTTGVSLLEQSKANGNADAQTMLWLIRAKNNMDVSFIQPVTFNKTYNLYAHQSPSLQYLDAINAWNAGDEKLSKIMLYKILVQYPNNPLAKKTYKQLTDSL